LEEYLEALPEVVKVLRVFDPIELRNSTAVYIAMREAKKNGFETFLTGDACDELFAGYSFLFNLDPPALRSALERMWKSMSFSAVPLGKSINMTAKIPFLDPEFKQLAVQVDPALLVVEQDGRKWGKWIIRKAFEEMLPRVITWRIKTPIEYGCGTTTLPEIFNARTSDEEFTEKQEQVREEDDVSIRDKEQLACYEVFRQVLGPNRANEEGKKCPECSYAIPDDATFCRTCGAWWRA
jgi:asparagine synthase (glutamine-hydrolysing)